MPVYNLLHLFIVIFIERKRYIIFKHFKIMLFNMVVVLLDYVFFIFTKHYILLISSKIIKQ